MAYALYLPKRPEPVLKIEDKQIQYTLGIVVLLASAEILQWTRTKQHVLATEMQPIMSRITSSGNIHVHKTPVLCTCARY